jgi:hypothetical protein
MAIVNPPEFLNNSAYTAKRWRRGVERMSNVQQGVWGNDFVVSLDASGWGYTVTGGSALVTAGTGNVGMYHVEADNSPPLLTGTLTPAHASLPRVDMIFIRVDDTVDTGSPDDDSQVMAATGTATAGATLGNRNGAVSPGGPSNMLHLADVLLPAGAASIAACTVRDRRTWARGVMSILQSTTGDITTSSTANFELCKQRVNIGRAGASGTQNTVEVGINCKVLHLAPPQYGTIQFQTQTNDSGTWTDIASGRRHTRRYPTGLHQQVHYFDTFSQAPANVLIRAVCSTPSNSLIVRQNSTEPLRFYIREHVATQVDTLAKRTP